MEKLDNYNNNNGEALYCNNNTANRRYEYTATTS